MMGGKLYPIIGVSESESEDFGNEAFIEVSSKPLY
jgi:hypothetical protein